MTASTIEETRMIDFDLPSQEANLEQVIRNLARTARSTGLDLAGGLLEALQAALAAQASGGR